MMRRKGLPGLFVFLLVFSELMGMRLWMAEEMGRARITGSYIAVAFFSAVLIGIAVSYILSYLPVRRAFCQSDEVNDNGAMSGRKTVKGLNRSFLILWGTLFLCYFPCFLAFYPGLYNNDMSWQWVMYIQGNYSTHHPLIHTLMAGWLFELGKHLYGTYNAGLAIYSCLQLLILSGCIAFALRYLMKIGTSRRVFLILLLFYALYPYIPVMGLSTTKDAVFGPLFLVLSVCLCEMVREKRVYYGWRLAAFLGIMVLAGTFRNNALYSFLLTAAFLAVCGLVLRFRCGRKKGRFFGKLTLVFVAGIVVSQISLTALNVACHAEQGKMNEIFSVPCQQLARAYVYHGGELSAEEKEELFRFIPEEALLNYVYYISDPVKNNLDDAEVKANPGAFAKLWVKMGLKYPIEYVEASLDNTFGIWYLTGDTGSSFPYEYLKPVDSEHYFTEESYLPALKQGYEWFNYKNYEKYLPVVSVIFYMPFFCWITLLGAFIMWKKGDIRFMIVAVFLLSYIVTVFLGPCVPVRYLFNILLSAPFFLASAQKTGAGDPERIEQKIKTNRTIK